MDIEIKNISCLDLRETLDCGQAFRWKETEEGHWIGIAYNKEIELSLSGDTLTLHNTSQDDCDNIWRHYLDLDRDYSGIEKVIAENETLAEMYKLCNGVRVLNQEPWETLCSFIISQNNNIKRIKGIIERLCETYGTKLQSGYSFPTAHRIAELSVEDLAPLRCGFRAKYILNAAKKVANDEINFDYIKSLPIDAARAELTKIYGVGDKVADCTLLFGLGFAEAFPKDVWIKRAMPLLFPDGLPEGCQGIEGIIQQYIFSYARKTKLDI